MERFRNIFSKINLRNIFKKYIWEINFQMFFIGIMGASIPKRVRKNL